MEIQIERDWNRPCGFLRHVLANERDGLDCEIHVLCAWVQVTHDTKNTVMRHVSPADLKAVGCSNPDVFVNGRRDDRIVLTRSRTNRQTRGKSPKVITNISAREVLGDEWESKLNIHKLEKVGYVIEELELIAPIAGIEHDSASSLAEQLLNDESAVLILVETGYSRWRATICANSLTKNA